MLKIPEKTIIEEIQPQCDNLHKMLKEQKEHLHITNQELSDQTGIPLSNIAKFFSGSLAHPSVFYVMAVCICLKQSLDVLLGNAREPLDATAAEKRIKELEVENLLLKQEVNFDKKYTDKLETMLEEQKTIIKSSLALAAVLAFAFLTYLSIDLTTPHAGFIQHDGISPGIIITVIAIAAAIGQTVYFVVKHHKNKPKKDDTHNE